MRALVALSLLSLTACGATESSSSSNVVGPLADAAASDDDASLGNDASLEFMDATGETTGPGTLDAAETALDSLPLDVVGSETLDAGDSFADVVSHVVVTDNTGEASLLDSTFTGYEPYVFGAEVYGDLLKLWASEGDTKIEFLVRLVQNPLPGSITPGPPGGGAWVLMLLGEENAYVTQKSVGALEIDLCPSEEGQLLTGTFEGIPMYNMSGLSTANFKISGSFELLLGSVSGQTYCAP